MVSLAGLGGNSITIVINAVDNFSKTFSKAKLGLKEFGKAGLIAGAVGAGIAVGFAKAIKSGIELESTMISVRKTTNLTAEETEVLRKEFIELSRVMPIAVNELAQVGVVAGQLGIEGKDNILEFTRVASMMGVATVLTAEEAALAMARISNAFGLPISEAERLGSVMNELSNTTAANSREIAAAMVRAAGSAATLGVSVDIVAGLSATLIAAGEPAERAGTRLKIAFDNIVINMDEIIKVMGKDFPDALRKDAGAAIIDLITKVSEIEDPLLRQQRTIEIFGRNAATAISKLTNNIPEMVENLKTSAEQYEVVTSLQDEYTLALQSTENQIQLVKNEFAAIGLQIGALFIPLIRNVLLPILKKMIGFWESLSPTIKTAIIIGTAATAMVLLLAGAIAIVTLVASPWLLIIFAIAAAIGLLVAGTFLLFKHWEELGTKTKILLAIMFPMIVLPIAIIKNWDKLKGAMIKIWDIILGIVERGVNSMINFINRLIDAVNVVRNALGFDDIKKIGHISIQGITTATLAEKAANMTFARPSDLLNQTLAPNQSRPFIGPQLNQTLVINGNVFGTDPDEIAEALNDKLRMRLSI
ncbi:MAG: phage tail tape measure protein [Thaumarchaeota archaeon]|nr:phage tail tape measure protein [Nitrososphaerota archaeon]